MDVNNLDGLDPAQSLHINALDIQTGEEIADQEADERNKDREVCHISFWTRN